MTSLSTNEYRLAISLLVDARQRAGMTQAGLASKLGRPQSFVSKFERGECRLDIVEYVHIADCLRTDPMSLARRVVAATLK